MRNGLSFLCYLASGIGNFVPAAIGFWNWLRYFKLQIISSHSDEPVPKTEVLGQALISFAVGSDTQEPAHQFAGSFRAVRIGNANKNW
jgi:hypothetical protein